METNCEYCTSRRANAVETGGIIRPLGIAEIGRAAGEGVGSHRRPDGVGEVRAGFHYDRSVVGPVDVESKLVGSHAEAGVADEPRVGLQKLYGVEAAATAVGGAGPNESASPNGLILPLAATSQ